MDLEKSALLSKTDHIEHHLAVDDHLYPDHVITNRGAGSYLSQRLRSLCHGEGLEVTCQPDLTLMRDSGRQRQAGGVSDARKSPSLWLLKGEEVVGTGRHTFQDNSRHAVFDSEVMMHEEKNHNCPSTNEYIYSKEQYSEDDLSPNMNFHESQLQEQCRLFASSSEKSHSLSQHSRESYSLRSNASVPSQAQNHTEIGSNCPQSPLGINKCSVFISVQPRRVLPYPKSIHHEIPAPFSDKHSCLLPFSYPLSTTSTGVCEDSDNNCWRKSDGRASSWQEGRDQVVNWSKKDGRGTGYVTEQQREWSERLGKCRDERNRARSWHEGWEGETDIQVRYHRDRMEDGSVNLAEKRPVMLGGTQRWKGCGDEAGIGLEEGESSMGDTALNRYDEKGRVEGWRGEGEEPGSWQQGEDRTGSWQLGDDRTRSWQLRDDGTHSWKQGEDRSRSWQQKEDRTGSWQQGEDRSGSWQQGEDRSGSWQQGNDGNHNWEQGEDRTDIWQPREDRTGSWQQGNDGTDIWQLRENRTGSWQQGEDRSRSWQQGADGTGSWQQGQDGTGSRQQEEDGTRSWQQRDDVTGRWQQGEGRTRSWQQGQDGTGSRQQEEDGTGSWQQRDDGTRSWQQGKDRTDIWQQGEDGTDSWRQARAELACWLRRTEAVLQRLPAPGSRATQLRMQIQQQTALHREVRRSQCRLEEFGRLTQQLMTRSCQMTSGHVTDAVMEILRRHSRLGDSVLARGRRLRAAVSSLCRVDASLESFSRRIGEMEAQLRHVEVQVGQIGTPLPVRRSQSESQLLSSAPSGTSCSRQPAGNPPDGRSCSVSDRLQLLKRQLLEARAGTVRAAGKQGTETDCSLSYNFSRIDEHPASADRNSVHPDGAEDDVPPAESHAASAVQPQPKLVPPKRPWRPITPPKPPKRAETTCLQRIPEAVTPQKPSEDTEVQWTAAANQISAESREDCKTDAEEKDNNVGTRMEVPGEETMVHSLMNVSNGHWGLQEDHKTNCSGGVQLELSTFRVATPTATPTAAPAAAPAAVDPEELAQLLLALQELQEWTVRKETELSLLRPLQADLPSLQQQQEEAQSLLEQLEERESLVQVKLETARSVVADTAASSPTGSLSGYSSLGRGRDVRRSISREASKLQLKWQKLRRTTVELHCQVDSALTKMRVLEKSMGDASDRLSELENDCDVTCDVTDTRLQALERSMDDINDQAARLTANSVSLSTELSERLDSLNSRLRQLTSTVTSEPGRGAPDLRRAVQHPWERAVTENGVPYYLHHGERRTQWDHPGLAAIKKDMADFDGVRFSAYRTALKLRRVQRALLLHRLPLSEAVETFDSNTVNLSDSGYISVAEIVSVLSVLYTRLEPATTPAQGEETADPAPGERVTEMDMCLSWLLCVFDCGRTGQIPASSFKVAIVALSRARLEEKYRYLFQLSADSRRRLDERQLSQLLRQLLQLPAQLGEAAAFSAASVPASVTSCFSAQEAEADATMAGTQPTLGEQQVLEWLREEPQSLVWLPVLHRVAGAENAVHQARCNVCREGPFTGFRYRCLKCFNFDMCQRCFFTGRVSKSHKLSHPMHEYCTESSSSDDIKDLAKSLRNRFKPKHYFRKHTRLGYLPVQPAAPSSPSSPRHELILEKGLGSNGLSASHPDVLPGPGSEEELHLIAQYCLNLPVGPSGGSPRNRDAQLRAVIRHLEQENRSLQQEYSRLLHETDGPTVSPISGTDQLSQSQSHSIDSESLDMSAGLPGSPQSQATRSLSSDIADQEADTKPGGEGRAPAATNGDLDTSLLVGSSAGDGESEEGAAEEEDHRGRGRLRSRVVSLDQHNRQLGLELSKLKRKLNGDSNGPPPTPLHERVPLSPALARLEALSNGGTNLARSSTLQTRSVVASHLASDSAQPLNGAAATPFSLTSRESHQLEMLNV